LEQIKIKCRACKKDAPSIRKRLNWKMKNTSSCRSGRRDFFYQEKGTPDGKAKP